MNTVFIELTDECNYNCEYCLIKGIHTLHNAVIKKERNYIDSQQLIKYIKTFLDHDNWYIYIAGGEPTLHPDFDYIIKTLSDLGFYGHIVTNGTKELKHYKNWNYISTWHKDKPFPILHDYITIIKNPDDNWQEKEKYCKDNNINYAITPFNDAPLKPLEILPTDINHGIQEEYCKKNNIKFELKDLSIKKDDSEIDYRKVYTIYFFFIGSHNVIMDCLTHSLFPQQTLQAMQPPPMMCLPQTPGQCSGCPTVAGLESHAPPHLYKKYIKDYEFFTGHAHPMEEKIEHS